MRRAIVLGERHLDLFLVAGLGADKLVLEAGDELAGAQDELGVGVGAALEGLAVDLAGVVHGDLVAVFGLAVLGRAYSAADWATRLTCSSTSSAGTSTTGRVILIDEKSPISIGGMISYFSENSKSASPERTFSASFSSSVMSISGCVADFSPRSAKHGARRVVDDLVDDLGHEGLAVPCGADA